MEEMICRNCTAPLDVSLAESNVLVCEFCGSKFTLPKEAQSDAVLGLLNAGARELAGGAFERAFDAFSQAAEEDDTEPEAYFGMALASFRIQYVKDCVYNRMQPICHLIDGGRFGDNRYYKRACELALPGQREVYEKQAEEIDRIKENFDAFRASGERFDVFICVKVTDDATGKPTDDNYRANDIYFMLKEKGYRPFFSERCIKARAGAEYEAMILYALYTSRCMLVVCSDESYLLTKWVRNEYTRYINLVNEEEKKKGSVTIVFDDRVIERLPGIRGKIQGIKYGFGAESAIESFVGTYCVSEEKLAQLAQAKAKAEEEAKRRAEEALKAEIIAEMTRKAEEEAKAKAEEEARRREAELRRKAEEEAKRREEELRRKAEEERLRAAEAMKAEEKRRAEEEAKAKAEEKRRIDAIQDDLRKTLETKFPDMVNSVKRKVAEDAKRKEDEAAQAKADEAAQDKAKYMEQMKKALNIIKGSPHAKLMDAELKAEKAAEELKYSRMTADELSDEGCNYYYGKSASQDLKKAAECFALAAEKGSVEGQGWLGYCYDTGEGVPQDYSKAAFWYTKAADAGDKAAQHKLAKLYQTGRGVAKDEKRAYRLCKQAAENGLVVAMVDLGYWYGNGIGVEKDETLAVEWYEKASKNGNVIADYNLGCVYQEGKGVPQDYGKAVEWYEKASKNGSVLADYNLGCLYREGRGVPRDYGKAVEYYRRAAEKKYARAINMLGYCYETGQGVSPSADNKKTALRYYLEASALEHAVATRNAAICYELGKGTQKDIAKAIEYYELAARQGHPKAADDAKRLRGK